MTAGTPPGSSDWYMGENIDAYRSGQVAMQMNFAFIWPGVEADPNVAVANQAISLTLLDLQVSLHSLAVKASRL